MGNIETKDQTMNIERLKALLELLSEDGKCQRDPYSLGLYNGVELALATLEERPVAPKNPLKEWLYL